jgi:uncharacterized protein YcbK (DUF882 family)
MNNFTLDEFECPCCGEQHMNHSFLEKLDEARSVANVPFIINSGWRCKEHNEKVGGSNTSSHLKGLAVDISAANSHARHRIVEALLSVGFNRIGVAKTFVHVDMDEEKPEEVMWVYQ